MSESSTEIVESDLVSWAGQTASIISELRMIAQRLSSLQEQLQQPLTVMRYPPQNVLLRYAPHSETGLAQSGIKRSENPDVTPQSPQ